MSLYLIIQQQLFTEVCGLFSTPPHSLPEHFTSPIMLRSLMNRFLGSHFISTSAIISCVGQYFSSTVPSITTCHNSECQGSFSMSSNLCDILNLIIGWSLLCARNYGPQFFSHQHHDSIVVSKWDNSTS